MHAVERQVREFVVENFLFGQEGRTVAGSDSFLELGIIDSTGILELVTFVETTFEIKVDDSELIPENLDSVDSLVAFIRRKSASRS